MRKEPKQDRSRKTRQSLMSALEALLKLKDFDQITVTEIAKTAGVSTGLLYAHFTNKADFLDALIEHYKARVIVRLEEVEKDDVRDEFRALGNLRSALRLISKFAYQQISEDAHIIRAITHSLKTRAATESEEWQDLRKRAFNTIAPVLDVYENELKRPKNTLTANMLVYFFNTIFTEALLLESGSQSNMPDTEEDVFTSEIADFVYGYLTTPPS